MRNYTGLWDLTQHPSAWGLVIRFSTYLIAKIFLLATTIPKSTEFDLYGIFQRNRECELLKTLLVSNGTITKLKSH